MIKTIIQLVRSYHTHHCAALLLYFMCAFLNYYTKTIVNDVSKKQVGFTVCMDLT